MFQRKNNFKTQSYHKTYLAYAIEQLKQLTDLLLNIFITFFKSL